MDDSTALQAIFDRLSAGEHLNQRELQALAAAVQSQQINIQTDDRAVAVGGSADGAVIMTGDGNIAITVTDSETVRALYEILEQSGRSKRPRNEKLLLEAVRTEVNDRLNQSLHNAMLINLHKEHQPEQVKRPWDPDIKVGRKPREPLPASMSILEVFDKPGIVGQLLILGKPGAGKTTTMLDLAKALIERAEQRSDCPIPAIFNLSAWKNNQQPIWEWLIEELKLRYGVRKQIGKSWLEKRQLLPMLDGLDELESIRQELCVARINELLESDYRPQHLVVCSRYEEYQSYENQLQMNGAVYLKSLKNEQIEEYLLQLNRGDLWQEFQQDWLLLELIRTPFWLSIVVLSEQELDVKDWSYRTTDERFQDLLDAYVRQMLTRDARSYAYSKRTFPTEKQTLRWLAYLAQQMRKESETEVLIEMIQPSWLMDTFSQFMYKSLKRLFLGLSLGLLFGLAGFIMFFSGSLIVKITSTAIMLALGLYVGIFIQLDESITPVETLRWSWEEWGRGFMQGIYRGLQFAETIAQVGRWNSDNIQYRIRRMFYHRKLGSAICLFLGLTIGAIGGALFGLMTGLTSGSAIENKLIPNQGIYRSAWNLANLGLIWALAVGFAFGAFSGLITHSINGLILGLFYGIGIGMIGGILLGLRKGGQACIQHLTLRFILYYQRRVPWNYAQFLNYCTDRLLLQRVGGRYRFIHRLLQEHFAAMPLESKER